MINYKKLETDGYLVVPNFLNSNDIDEILSQFKHYKSEFDISGPVNKNNNVILSDITESLKYKAQSLLENICKETDIIVTGISRKIENLDSSIIKFGWHQDHEMYYTHQDAYNCVHFWIPIVKPDITQTGIDVIPHSKFEEQSPDIFKKYIKAKGAKRFLLRPPNIEMHDDEGGDLVMLDFDLNIVKETPIVGPGDLILLRGDTIHRSQLRSDNSPWRMSIAFWAFNLDAVLSKERFYSGCEMKRSMIANNPTAYNGLEKLYKTATELTIRNFLK